MYSRLFATAVVVSLFALAAAPQHEKVDKSQLHTFVFSQFRAMISTTNMEKSMLVMQELLNFIHELHDMDQATLKRLECMVVEFGEQLDKIGESLQQQKSKNRGLQEQLVNKTKENEEHVLNIQNMHTKLDEYQRRIQELEQQIKKPNNTVETHNPGNWTRECEQYTNLDKIRDAVHAYMNDKNWLTLHTGLLNALDYNSSVEYQQLRQAGSLWGVGWLNSTQLATLLLCAGLSANTVDGDNNTMLHGAAYKGHLDLAKLLLGRGADVNERGNYDNTPLMRAASGYQLEMVEYLVQAGADTTAMDHDGCTALACARAYGHTSVADYLQQLPH